MSPLLPSTNGFAHQTSDSLASRTSTPTAQRDDSNIVTGTFRLKTGLAQKLKGGVIVDVVNVQQARIANESPAVAVMVLQRAASDIKAEGGISRMCDPAVIKEVRDAIDVETVVMAKVRIGHFVEAQILQAIGVDFIHESEVLTPADEENYINKHEFKIPFACDARNLGEALRRISEGAAFIRTKGEAGTGNIVEVVRHQRTIMNEIRMANVMNEEELYAYAKEIRAPFDLLKECARLKRLPRNVVNFAAGGITTPADAALMMQLGCDGVFVESDIFHSNDARKRMEAIVQAVCWHDKPDYLAKVQNANKMD